MYQYSNEILKKLKPTITKQFNNNRLLIKDELNTLRNVKRLYKKLLQQNEELYLDAASEAYKEAGGTEKVDKKWLAGFLNDYGLITGYVYINEVERKRDRLIEALLAGQNAFLAYKRAASLWKQQTEQGMIDVVDSATMKAFKDRGVKKVVWVSQEDNNVCKKCKDLNGKVFDIDKAPKKTHYYCRCYLKEFKEE